jgi:outer membrane PBP1 activator LpoA protein
MQLKYPVLLSLLLLLFTLVGCGGIYTPTRSSVEYSQSQMPASLSSNPLFQRAIALEQSGNYSAAAALFAQLADQTQPPVRQQALLRAVEDYLSAGEHDSAYQLLPRVGTRGLPRLSAQKRILFAEVALQRNQPNEALELLQQKPPSSVAPDVMRRYYYARIDAFRSAGNVMESARAQSELDLLLTDPRARLDNQQMIIRSLSVYTDDALKMLQPNPPGLFGGWMELTLIIKAYSNDPHSGQRRLERWRERFSSHPALPELLKGYFQRVGAMYKSPSHVAVLLPKSGAYAKPAAAVRAGLMAAHSAASGQGRPELRFYDSSHSSGIHNVYRQAVQDGAEMVIGPLSKSAVSRLVQGGSLDRAVLTLNQLSGNGSGPSNLYQFALSPEDEARQVAERAWSDGHTKALALSSDDAWGRRLFAAFSSRWKQLGGTLLEHQTYDPKEHDFSQPIQDVLNISNSNARYKALRKVVGRKIEFQPRRRQDAGFIFIAAKTQLARQVRPQLQFHHGADLPVYSTSHAYSGNPESTENMDLEGVKFPDMPWVLMAGARQSTLAKKLPASLTRYSRLFAMGIDAYRILPHLSRLQSGSHETLDGKTGILSLDSDRRVHRKLVWARMRNGEPKVAGYSGSP